MKGLRAVFKRECAAYFNAPIAYVFAVVFLLVANGLFMTTFFLAGLCDMRSFFHSLPFLLVIFVPALTMRLWAEERKTGTIALLYSLPCSPWALTLGKFGATFFFVLLTLLSTFIIPVMLSFLGNPDWGPILGGYLGAALLAAFLIALGQSVSAFFEDQIVAFILALLIGAAALLVGSDLVASSIESWFPGLGGFLRLALGLTPHFTAFTKGVLSLTNVLFFGSYTLAFLWLNVLTIKGYLRYFGRRNFYLGTLFLFGALLFLNASWAHLRLPRLDLTEGKVYTVSPAARKVLEKLEVPIRVTYYVSSKDQLPAPMRTIARDVADILAEFAALSPKFTYRVVDPTKDPDLIPKLREKGIVPFAVQTIERDQVSVRRIYSALAISYLDKREEVIPQVMPENLATLEYDIISRIYKLTLPETPVIALKSPSPPPSTFMMAPQDAYRVLRQVLEYQGFEVRGTPITKEVGIPEEARLLLVVEPGELNDRQLYEIERFLARGRPVIIAAQGYKYSYNPGPEGEITAFPLKQSLAINKLLKPFGLRIDDHLLMDAQSAVLALSVPRRIGMFTAIVRQPVRFPMQIKVLPEQMNQKLSVTSNLSALLYLWGSALAVDEKRLSQAGLKKETFFTSSRLSWLEDFRPGALSPKDLHPDPQDEKGPFLLAVMLSGTFPEVFKEAPPWPGEEKEKAEKKEKGPEPEKIKERRPSRLVLVGSSEMFADSAIEAFSNAVFLANLVESLTLGEELLYIRAKTQVQRYLREVSAPEKFFWRLTVTALPPTLWVLAGLSRAFYRRRRRERHLRRAS